jgi:hypothetical protein
MSHGPSRTERPTLPGTGVQLIPLGLENVDGPARVRARAQDGLGRHRVEAARLVLSFGTLARLDQKQENAPAVKREAEEDWGR